MSRTVPAALQSHLDGGVTTTCLLLKIVPVNSEYDTLGLCSTNSNVSYDDNTGGGAITYYATIGVQLSNMASSSDMTVDNAEATALVPEFDVPVSEADLVAGAYDYARWTLYLVNYLDLTAGRHAALGSGELGQVRVLDGLRFTFETLGLTHRLKQSIVQKDSLRCRAIFGSQPEGTVGAEVIERFPCGKDTSAMWVSGAVTAVGAESQYACTTDLAAAANAYTPGKLRWLTGANAGREIEVETHSTGGVLLFAFPCMFAIEVGDTFEIRADCTHWKTGANSCFTHHGADWVLHYRGEPWIPVGDQDQINTPGANG